MFKLRSLHMLLHANALKAMVDLTSTIYITVRIFYTSDSEIQANWRLLWRISIREIGYIYMYIGSQGNSVRDLFANFCHNNSFDHTVQAS